MNLVDTLYLMIRNLDFVFMIDHVFKTQILQSSCCKNKFQHKNAFQGPGFLGSRFFRVHICLGPGFSGSKFFRVQVFLGQDFSRSGSRVRVQVLEVAKINKYMWRRRNYWKKLNRALVNPIAQQSFLKYIRKGLLAIFKLP